MHVHSGPTKNMQEKSTTFKKLPSVWNATFQVQMVLILLFGNEIKETLFAYPDTLLLFEDFYLSSFDGKNFECDDSYPIRPLCISRTLQKLPPQKPQT